MGPARRERETDIGCNPFRKFAIYVRLLDRRIVTCVLVRHGWKGKLVSHERVVRGDRRREKAVSHDAMTESWDRGRQGERCSEHEAHACIGTKHRSSPKTKESRAHAASSVAASSRAPMHGGGLTLPSVGRGRGE